MGKLRDKADRKQIKDVEELKRLLKEELLAILNARQHDAGRAKSMARPKSFWWSASTAPARPRPSASCRRSFARRAKTVLLCAADTFRAAAIEQLEIWGQRTGTEVIQTKAGGDPAAVLFDALQAATARNTDYVIVDTAGRLHTKANLDG